MVTFFLLHHFKSSFLMMFSTLKAKLLFHFLFDFFSTGLVPDANLLRIDQWRSCCHRLDGGICSILYWCVGVNTSWWQFSSWRSCNWLKQRFLQSVEIFPINISKILQKNWNEDQMIRGTHFSPNNLISHSRSWSSSTHSSETCFSVFCGVSGRFRLRRPDRLGVLSNDVSEQSSQTKIQWIKW